MTTALIGKQGASGSKARVAVVSRVGESGLAQTMRRSGHEVQEFAEWGTAAAALAAAALDLVFCDDTTASERPSQFGAPVALVTDQPAPASAAGCLAIPAAVFDVVADAVLALAVELRARTVRCRELEAVVGDVVSGSALVGQSPIMRRLQGVISRAADTDATVLVEGPVGSGKSLAARVIHCKSRRSGKPLMTADSRSLDGEAMAALIDQARDTTLVIDDIDQLPATGQSVLVKHLKERSGPRAATAPRLVATTSAHLPEAIAKGAFREDLYYRLHAFPMVMPALRERVSDIAAIGEALLAGTPASGAAARGRFTPAALLLLESMAWPGNVAQFELVVRRAQALAGGAPIDREHILAPPVAVGAPARVAGGEARPSAATEGDDGLTEDSIRPFEEEEQMLLSRALRATKGNVRRAAQLLGIGRATLYRKIQQYKLRLQ